MSLEHLVYPLPFLGKNIIFRLMNDIMELSIPVSHGISIAKVFHGQFLMIEESASPQVKGNCTWNHYLPPKNDENMKGI